MADSGVADVELMVTRAAAAIRTILGRLATLAFGLTALAVVVGAATYATGLWVSDGLVWPILGLVLCVLPAAVGARAWLRVKRTQAQAPAALLDLRALIFDRRSQGAMNALIDVDTQQPVIATVRSLAGLSADLEARGSDRVALAQTLRAAMTVPGLAALTVIGVVLLGALGSMMLLIGLLR